MQVKATNGADQEESVMWEGTSGAVLPESKAREASKARRDWKVLWRPGKAGGEKPEVGSLTGAQEVATLRSLSPFKWLEGKGQERQGLEREGPGSGRGAGNRLGGGNQEVAPQASQSPLRRV